MHTPAELGHDRIAAQRSTSRRKLHRRAVLLVTVAGVCVSSRSALRDRCVAEDERAADARDMFDPTQLPDDLPVPQDDGAADHLRGMRMPAIELEATNGERVRLDDSARTVVYIYPRSGQPGVPMPADDWDQIPGARGCTTQACDMRDHHAELRRAGADRVFGLSTQDSAYQVRASRSMIRSAGTTSMLVADWISSA